MRRKWFLSAAAIVLAGGSVFATVGPASAAVRARPLAVRPGAPDRHLIRPFTARTGTPAAVTSSNWSGYAATGRPGAFSSVSASWVEPTGTCSSGDQYSSFWVGLDGYSSHTVEQAGADVDCAGNAPEYYTWYEMYPYPAYELPNTVMPGDNLSASVTYAGAGKFILTITDHTQNWTQTERKTLASAKRSSAEVVVEAPSSFFGVLPLADFGTADFSSAAVNGTALSSYNPTQIIMESGGTQKDAISALSPMGRFSATWLHR